MTVQRYGGKLTREDWRQRRAARTLPPPSAGMACHSNLTSAGWASAAQWTQSQQHVALRPACQNMLLFIGEKMAPQLAKMSSIQHSIPKSGLSFFYRSQTHARTRGFVGELPSPVRKQNIVKMCRDPWENDLVVVRISDGLDERCLRNPEGLVSVSTEKGRHGNHSKSRSWHCAEITEVHDSVRKCQNPYL